MAFKERGFDQPIYQEKVDEPTRIIIIACEGCNTEPDYFETIKSKLPDQISSLLEVAIVPKPTRASEPEDVLNNLEDFVEKYDYQQDHDSLWIVCDREKVEDRKHGSKGLLKILPICDQEGYKLALTNPLFELWLLMHITDISTYNVNDLFINDYINPASKNRRFIDKELSNILEGGYNKKSGNFNTSIVSKNNIKRALEQETLFENNRDLIVDNLGSNIGDLIRDILPDI